METDLAAEPEQRLDDARPELVVRLRRRPILDDPVRRHEKEDRRSSAAPLQGGDAFEAEVRVGATQPVDRHGRQSTHLAPCGVASPLVHGGLQPAGAEPYALACPAPGNVDIVTQRHREAGTAPARGLETELPAQSLERRVEGFETRGGGREAAVLVTRTRPLLDAREVEERLGEIVALRALASLDLPPGTLPVGNVVAETQVVSAKRVEHPAGAPLHLGRDQRSAALTTRAN